jgi:hypothetical protein
LVDRRRIDVLGKRRHEADVQQIDRAGRVAPEVALLDDAAEGLEQPFAARKARHAVLAEHVPAVNLTNRTSVGHLGAIFGERELDAREEGSRRAGLGEKSADLSIVDRRDRRGHVVAAGQENAARVRRNRARGGEKLRTVHTRHAQIGNDDGRVGVLPEQPQAFGAARGQFHLVRRVQVGRDRLEDLPVVVHAEYARVILIIHGVWSGGGRWFVPSFITVSSA